MKLLLIQPKSGRSYWGGVSKSGKAGFMRLCLPTIAALTPSSWNIEIVDNRVTEIDYQTDADLIGITGLTSDIPSSYEIADNFRKAGKPVVIGGVHVSAMPDEALTHADSVVIGEAELIWKGLLKDFQDGKMKKKYEAVRLCDTKDMIIPRRELIDRSMYGSGFNTLQATRGCPFDCEYCAVTTFFGNEYRVRPVADVLNEVKGLGTDKFFFMDDNIVGRPKYAKKLFKELAKLNVTWGSQASITMADDPELLELYYKSGGRYAFIGLESLSQKNLEKVNKGWNSAESFKKSIRKIHDAGIEIVASFVFGLDDDDKSVFRNTFDFVMETKVAAAQFHILTPLPGTGTHKKLDEAGRITDRDWGKYHTGEVVFKPSGMTAEELQQGYFWIFRETYKMKNVLKRSFTRGPRGLVTRISMNFSYRKKSLLMPEVPELK